MTTFNEGDRVRRVGPHRLSGLGDANDFGDRECQVGDVGTVETTWGDGDVSVKWDRTGRFSAIVATSLEPETPEPTTLSADVGDLTEHLDMRRVAAVAVAAQIVQTLGHEEIYLGDVLEVADFLLTEDEPAAAEYPPVSVEDSDGDVWTRDEDGMYRSPGLSPRTYEALAADYGPLTPR
jgi:hypothetical protein